MNEPNSGEIFQARKNWKAVCVCICEHACVCERVRESTFIIKVSL